MYTKSIIRTLCSLAAIAGLFISCKETSEDLGAPSLEINPSELSFEKAGDTKTVSVTATRDWVASTEEEWISVQPKSGKASKDPVTVEITVLENTGLDREPGSVKFDIGFDTKTLTVNQKGSGSAADRIVYSNNFDKEAATKTYGTSGSSWPYLDQFEGWKNAEGTGAGSETYSNSGMSVRNNSNSNGSYSDYEGSGVNNLFFGTSAYFSVSGIKLPAQTNYSISFGSEKYLNDGDSNFKHSEFHVFISNDGKKWVELEYAFPSGDKEGKWDIATANFTLPSGTAALSIYIKADVASAYRLDDLSLNIASEAGTAIDFSKGIEISTDSDSGDDDYTKAEQKTVAEFIAAANTSKYYRLKGKVSNFNSQYCSFDLTDGTGSIYVYSVSNKSDWSSKIKNEGTVELAGKYKQYNSTDEVVNAYILSFEEGAETPATEMSIADVLASDEGVKAQVSGIVAGTYKKGFIITDGKDYLLVYDGNKCDAKVKDKVTVIGTTDVYGGLTQLASPAVTVVSSDNELTLPEPKVLSGSDFDSYSSDKVEYITYEGVLSVSGSYYNVDVDGASTHIGSLSYVDDSYNASSYDKTAVKVTGFFVGISGSSNQYVNTMVTDLKPSASSYLNVSTEDLTAKADETSATFEIKSNVDWTVTSDNEAYTVEPASGENDGTVTVKFAANETENDVKVNLTVSTTADVATKSYTVVLTHKGKSSASAGDFSSSVTWDNTSSDNASYSDKAKINGGEAVSVLKLGTGKKAGYATLSIPAGTKTLTFYALSWKNKTAKLSFEYNDAQIGDTFSPNANDGCTSTSPYTIDGVTDADRYTLDLTSINGGQALSAETTISIKSIKDKDYRVIVFGINAEK